MPEKTRAQRVKLARKRGKTMALKAAETGGVAGKSNHATKKSAHVQAQVKPGGRSTSMRMPPGSGKLNVDRTVAAFSARAKVERSATPADPDDVRPALKGLRGRKKAPGSAAIKRKGGPFKRSRLKGG